MVVGECVCLFVFICVVWFEWWDDIWYVFDEMGVMLVDVFVVVFVNVGDVVCFVGL